jgi:hypothetical protein
VSGFRIVKGCSTKYKSWTRAKSAVAVCTVINWPNELWGRCGSGEKQRLRIFALCTNYSVSVASTTCGQGLPRDKTI